MRRYLQTEGRAPDELAILYRTHAQSRSFEDALRALKIPYRIYGGLKFYDRKEVKDVLAYFRVIMNPEDSVSLKRVINTPARGIGKTTLDKLDEALMERIAIQPTARYWDVLRDAASGKMGFTKGTAKKLEGFVSLIHKWIDLEPKSTITDLYHAVLDDTRYVELLRIEGTEEAEARIENLESLGSSIKEFEDKDENKKQLIGLLPKFLEEVTLASDVQGDGEQLPSVLMMTLHGCKGLEFPIVFLVGMEEGLFPAGSRNPFESENEEDMEEERRLCYVGMTRAREKLYLTEAAMRRQWGEIQVQRSSRFLKEIPNEYVETHNLTKSFSGGGYGFNSYGSGGSGRGGSSGSSSGGGYRYEED
jgi:DNA helicase-2/ATP-dependent DNA helicase PcrA